VSPAASPGQAARDAHPLVLTLTATPLLTDLLRDLLDEVAEIRHFPAGSADLQGLVRHTMPDAVILDGDEDALELSDVADELSVPLIQILLSAHEIRVFRDGRWHPSTLPIESPTTIRNVLVGELFHASPAERKPMPALTGTDHHRMES
jgi:hypothetical protein